MFIVDGQVHIWAPNTPERPWRMEEPPHREVPLGAKELLDEMQAANVQRMVLVPPYWDAYRSDLALEAARLHPDRFAVVGRPDTQAPESRSLVANWCKQPGMLGMRCSFTRPHQISTLKENRAEWLWDEAEKNGVPVMVNVPHLSLHLIDAVAEHHPGLKLAIDHLGIPKGAKDDEAFRDLDKLLMLGRRSNINVKASALPDFTDDDYPYRRLHPYLRRIYDAFGPMRIFWASDLSRLRCSNYAQVVTMITEEIPWLSKEDKEWIMGRSLCQWLGWALPADC